MKNVIAFSLILMMLLLTSCEIVGDIFSAGVYTGIFIVVIVIVAVIWIFLKLRNR